MADISDPTVQPLVVEEPSAPPETTAASTPEETHAEGNVLTDDAMTISEAPVMADPVTSSETVAGSMPEGTQAESNVSTKDAMTIPEDTPTAIASSSAVPALAPQAEGVAAEKALSASNAPGEPMSARDVAYAFTTTLAFVSPHTFGENARLTKATTDGLDARVTVLEQQAGDDERIKRLIEAALAPILAGVQAQVDKLLASSAAKVNSLTEGLHSLEQQLSAKLLEANELKARLAAVEEGGLDHSHERIDALEAGMEEAQTALSEQKAETVRVEGQATQAQQLAENVAAALEASRAAVDAAAAENAALRAELDARFLATAQESEARSLGIEAIAAQAAKANQLSVEEAREAASSDLNQMRLELEDRLTAIANDRTADREREAAAAEAQALADARAALVEEALAKIRASAAAEAAALAEVKDEVAVLYADRHHHDQHDGDRRARLEEHCRNNNSHNNNNFSGPNMNSHNGVETLLPLDAPKVVNSNGDNSGGVDGRSAEWLVEKALDALYHPLVNPTTVAEHDKLLRALVLKVNAQGRCLSGLVSDAKARREMELAARAAKDKDGIAVQCLSCLRPIPDTMPRLRESSSIIGGGMPTSGPWANAPGTDGHSTPFAAQFQAPPPSSSGQPKQSKHAKQRPKSAGRARSNTAAAVPFGSGSKPTLHSRQQPEAFDVGGVSTGEWYPPANVAVGSAVGYVKGLKGDGGAGVLQGGAAQRFAGGRLSPGQNPWEPLTDGAPDHNPSVELPNDNDPDALLLDQELKEPVGPGSGNHKDERKDELDHRHRRQQQQHQPPLLLQHPQAARRTSASAQTTDRPYDRQTTVRPGSSHGGNSRDFRASRPRSAGTLRPPSSQQQQRESSNGNGNGNPPSSSPQVSGNNPTAGLAGSGAGVDVTRAASGSGLGFAEVQWKGGAP